MTKEARKKRKLFSRFYDSHIERVYRFIYFKVGSKEVSEDITAEAFIRLWEQMKSPTEIRSPQAYVYQVARNLVIDHYRTQEPVKIRPDKLALESERPDPEKKVILDEEAEQLRLVLSKIKNSYQNVLILYYLDEMPISEIAQIEGKSENAVRVTIHRALNALKQELEKAQQPAQKELFE